MVHRRSVALVILAAALIAPLVVVVSPGSVTWRIVWPTTYIVGVEDASTFEMTGVYRTYVAGTNTDANFVVIRTWSAPDLFDALADRGEVRYIEKDQSVLRALGEPNDPRYDEQYALARIHAREAWEYETGSTRVIIAIIDSGVDFIHDDLRTLVHGAVFTEEEDYRDLCRHGTHVAGIAAATTNNGLGVSGVATASILPVKVLGADCSGTYSAVANGITWAVDAGARVIALGMGCRACSSHAVSDALDYASRSGALILAPAGNNGPCDECVMFPARHVAVMAVACTTREDVACGFSASGSDVEIAAPGDSVLSTAPGDRYETRSGTSMSVPHVAGTAALLLSHAPSLSAAELRAMLVNTARDVGDPGWDDATGAGVVNAAAALKAVAAWETRASAAPEK